MEQVGNTVKKKVNLQECEKYGIEESKKDNGEEIIHLDIVDYDDEWKR